MKLRSLLFVPADRPERYAKALESGADAIIIDLEDSVAPAKKPAARDAVKEFLSSPREGTVLVRVNPVDGDDLPDDLEAVLPVPPEGLMLPKAEGENSISTLSRMMDGASVPVLPICTETPGAVFELGSFRKASLPLLGMTWGAEDLSAAIGAATARNTDGTFTTPYLLARDLLLFAAHAAGVPAIETVYTDIRDLDGLTVYATKGRRDGFAGMMAIHPTQVEAINRAFEPTPAEIEWAQSIIAVFEANPGAGAIQHDGKMIDKPHLVQAQRILAQAE